MQANYRYNALGQQVVRELTQTGETIHVVHDPDGNRIAEYDYDSATGTSTLIRPYVWIEGRPVAVVEGGQIYYVRTDHIGRPVFATNNLGVKVWEASYLPFGGVHTATGGIDLRFPGQWFQAENGLHQNWMRDYDPTTGRYVEADPLGLIDGASVYGYVRQNPGRWTDPRGECPQCAAIPVVEWAVGVLGGSSAGASATGVSIGVGILSMAPSRMGDDTIPNIGVIEPEWCQRNDCPLEMPIRELKRIRDNDPRLRYLDPHTLKDSGAEDLYINTRGCVYVGPAKNSREYIGSEAVAYWTGIRI